MSDDIVERLRNPSGDGDATLVMLAAMREAAAEIERLRAELAEARMDVIRIELLAAGTFGGVT